MSEETLEERTKLSFKEELVDTLLIYSPVYGLAREVVRGVRGNPRFDNRVSQVLWYTALMLFQEEYHILGQIIYQSTLK